MDWISFAVVVRGEARLTHQHAIYAIGNEIARRTNVHGRIARIGASFGCPGRCAARLMRCDQKQERGALRCRPGPPRTERVAIPDQRCTTRAQSGSAADAFGRSALAPPSR